MSFLSSLLPMVAGAASTYFTGNPYLGMALAGGVTAQKTGSLQKGILAGLGAYGGGSLATGLANAGTAGATNAISESATLAGEEAAKQEMARQASIQQAAVNSPTAQNLEALTRMNAVGTDAAIQSARDFATNNYAPTAAQTAALNNPMQTGLSGIGTEAGNKAFMNSIGGAKGLTMAGLAAAAPALINQPQLNPIAPVGDNAMPQRLQYNQGAINPFAQPDVPAYGNMNQNFGRQRNYFPNAGYEQITPDQARSIRGYADGGMMDAAGGGPVEQMSNKAAIGANTMYPMANMTTSAFATPYQTPHGTDMIAPSGGATVNQMTGELNPQGTRLAGGGMPSDKYFSIPSAGSASDSSASVGANAGITGSPTGSFMGDLGYSLSNMSALSPTVAAIAGALMDAYSSTSPTSANATNGMDVASDNAVATGVADSSSPAAPGPAASDSADGGSDAGGEARGGLMPSHRYHMAKGGIADAYYNLGGYSDGGRLLRGPGDGVSDSIPAVIGHKQPARLADGEFVVPARIVSELGNGSTEAGARKLYAMMDRVQHARGKTVGKGKIAKNTRADKYLPA